MPLFLPVVEHLLDDWASVRITGKDQDVDLAYALRGLPPAADYEVSFYPEGHLNAVRNGVDSSLNPTNIHFVTRDAAAISGTITGAKANSYVGVEVVCLDTGDRKSEPVLTNGVGGGAYTVQGLDEGKYLISAKNCGEIVYYDQIRNWRNATELNLANGSKTGIDFNFGEKAYAVTGAIAGIPDRRPVVVTAWDDINGGWATAERAGSGSFQLDLPAGLYKIAIFAERCGELYYACSGAVTSDWSAASVVAVDAAKSLGTLTLTPGYAISGRVYYDANGNRQYEPGEELDGLSVAVSGGGLWRDGITDDSGRYSVDGLATGRTYDIVVTSTFGSHAGQITVNGTDVVYDIRLGGTDAAKISVAVAKGGAPATGAMVLLFGPQGFINAILTDNLGQGSFAGLPTGQTYSLKVDHDGDGTIDYNAGGATAFPVVVGDNLQEIVLP